MSPMNPSPSYWKSWPGAQNASRDEFPAGAAEWDPSLNRRRFLQLALSSLAAAGFTGCVRAPLEKIFPYVENPSQDPGQAVYYASAVRVGGLSHGLLVETHEGHPVRVDGHPDHPATRGASTAWQQAFVLSLYSEQRSRQIWRDESESTWEDWEKEVEALRADLRHSRGRGFYILSEIDPSPSMKEQMDELRALYPELTWIQDEALTFENELDANHRVFGQEVQTVYHFNKADVVISLAADFVQHPLYPLSYARDFMARRREEEIQNRRPYLRVCEATPSLTGAIADERRIVEASDLTEQARLLYQALSHPESAADKELHRKIMSHAGRCLFIAGPEQASEVHAVCQFLNARYGRECVSWIPAFLPRGQRARREKFLKDLRGGQVQALFVLGGEPAYHWNLDEATRAAWKKIPRSYRFALHRDLTSSLCHWHLPLAHAFEAGSEGLAFNGTPTLSQALVEPLFNGRSSLDILSKLAGSSSRPKDRWRQSWSAEQKARGLGKAPALRQLKPVIDSPSFAKAAPLDTQLHVLFRPDDFIGDGRFFDNSWLRECPRPLTSLSWENAILISPELARERKIKIGQMLRLKTKDGGQVQGPAWVLPGQAPKTLSLIIGFGQGPDGEARGYRAADLGVDYDLTPAVSLEVMDEMQSLACTQSHQTIDTESPLRKNPAKSAGTSLYLAHAPKLSPQVAWGMVIDLDACTGCSACTVACQSENNIAVVGKEGVLRGRQMHWIRVDRYFSGPPEQPKIYFQPVPCMHCENAPCEAVCPVGATMHSTEGLNQMIYNRCVGTRYCSNNCPYKVRRFNFLSYREKPGDLRNWRKNPAVTVRSRGVMEKCTYCVQRIEAARIQAQEGGPGFNEVRTACQVACPTQAIVFGNLRQEDSAVARARRHDRHYALLEELNTHPRTTYLSPKGVLS